MKIAPVRLEGRHACLIPLERGHAPTLFAVGGGPEVWRYMPSKVESEGDMRAWVDEALAARDAGAELPFAITDATGRIVGSTRLLDISVPHRGLEIGGTWLAPEVWRTAVNTECKYLLLRHCFQTLGAIRVQFKTDSRNVRSQRALERLGAVKEGVLRHHRILPDGYLRDSVYYSILAGEWPDVKTRLEGFLSRPE